MGLNLQNVALSLPANTEFPGTPQALLNLIAAYMAITGQDSFNGVNYGPTTPSEDNRDKPWFKTDESFNPIGWFSWNGADWTAIPMVMPSGATANRPASPTAGQLYFDTDINVALVYERSMWRTVSGTPGDTKCVIAASDTAALTANPGWALDTDSAGMVEAAPGLGHDNGDTGGADTVTLTTDEIPAHTHTVSIACGENVNTGQYLDDGEVSDSPPKNNTYTSSSVGGGEAHENRQPTIYRYRLYKL